MKRNILCFMICLMSSLWLTAAGSDRLFRTSRCLDLLASIQYFDQFADNPQFEHLFADSAFMAAVESVNDRVEGRDLCNLYVLSGGSLDDINDCVIYFNNLTPEAVPEGYEPVADCNREIAVIINRMQDADFDDYWSFSVYPVLTERIECCGVDPRMIDRIDREVNRLAGDLGRYGSTGAIYILNIDNYFTLDDGSLCSTYYLLDRETARSYGVDFLKTYIQGAVRIIRIPDELFSRLSDTRQSEEAIYAAAEACVEYSAGIYSLKELVERFGGNPTAYMDITPIVFEALTVRPSAQSLVDCVSRLFANGKIKAGKIGKQRTASINRLRKMIH